MKTCTKCSIEKDFSEFYSNKRSKSGYTARCKDCMRAENRRWKKENPDRVKEQDRKFKRSNREKLAEKQREFYQRNKDYYRKKCEDYYRNNPGIFKDYQREYQRLRYANPETRKIMLEQRKKYRQENPDVVQYHRRKRKALIRGSKVEFSKEEYLELMTRFENKCSLSNSSDIHLDHFIPICTGYGDTTINNLIPLDASLNISKNGSNPFEWIKTRNDIDRERFNDVVFYLAELNGFTPEEYEAHVYNCFD